MTTRNLSPPGWFRDPVGRHEHRYWDGRNWTASVSDGVTTTDPLEVPAAPATEATTSDGTGPWPPPAPGEDGQGRLKAGARLSGALPPPPPPPPRRHRGRVLALVGGVLLTLVGILGFIAANVNDNHNEKTFAADYAALGAQDADSAAGELDAIGAEVKKAYDAYVAAANKVAARHEAVTDKFNEVTSPLNPFNRLGVLRAQDELPRVIAAYEAAVKQERAAAQAYFKELGLLKAVRAR